MDGRNTRTELAEAPAVGGRSGGGCGGEGGEAPPPLSWHSYGLPARCSGSGEVKERGAGRLGAAAALLHTSRPLGQRGGRGVRIQQQQQLSLLSQASWGRLEMKPTEIRIRNTKRV
jgi:hypothetical protein